MSTLGCFEKKNIYFFDYAYRGQQLLTDEQIERAEAIYHAKKNKGLSRLAQTLDNAVVPAFTFRQIPGTKSFSQEEVATQSS